MKKLLALSVLAWCILITGPAVADIPSYVDYLAVQTNPMSGGSWNVIKGSSWGSPVWQDYETLIDRPGVDPVDYSVLHIPNISRPDLDKYLWLEIHFNEDYMPEDPSDPITSPIAIVVSAPGSSVMGDPVLTGRRLYNDQDPDEVIGSVLTWEWRLSPQPEWEEIAFFDMTYWMSSLVQRQEVGEFYSDGKSDADITEIHVGTYCVPTPGAIVLCVIGLGFGFVTRRFRR